MVWPSLTTTETLSGKGAKIVGSSLHARQRECSERGTTWHFAEYTVTGSYASAALFEVRMPAWALTNCDIGVTVLLKAASGTITLRLDETTSSTAGTETAHSPAATYGPFLQSLTVPDDTWAGTIRQLDLQAKFSGSSAFAKGELVACNLRLEAV